MPYLVSTFGNLVSSTNSCATNTDNAVHKVSMDYDISHPVYVCFFPRSYIWICLSADVAQVTQVI